MLADKRIASLKTVFPALLGMLFCLWSARGNEVNFCATAGCSLYQDTTIAGISLWWYGTGAFALLALAAVFAPRRIGLPFSTCALMADTCLLALLALTAPCTNCLVAGAFFALTFVGFRRLSVERKSRISVILSIWLVFFSLNVWAVAKSALGPWPVYGEPDEATIHIYFSPSCPRCKDVVSFYAGNVDAVFYPVADNGDDTGKIQIMQDAIQDGAGMEKALALAVESRGQSRLPSASLLTSFRLLRNKAHVFLAGSRGVPFIEYRGMPQLISRELKRRRFIEQDEEDRKVEKEHETTESPLHDLPPELMGTEQQCTRETCP